MKDDKGDIRTVQELMGHSTITMTMRYAHPSPRNLREASEKGVEELIGDIAESDEILPRSIGGAERGRTAASQFCRLLP